METEVIEGISLSLEKATKLSEWRLVKSESVAAVQCAALLIDFLVLVSHSNLYVSRIKP